MSTDRRSAAAAWGLFGATATETGARGKRSAVARRATWSTWLRQAAFLAFAILVVLSPLRARIPLVARPVVPVYGDFTDFLLFWSDIAALVTIALWLVSLALDAR